jgi:transcriptional regulator with XRE-family HTH domain
MSIATRLVELRQEKGLNRRELAQKLGFPYSTYSHYEIGDREPDSEKLRIICNYFNVTIDYLLDNKPQSDNQNDTIEAFAKAGIDIASLPKEKIDMLIDYAKYILDKRK